MDLFLRLTQEIGFVVIGGATGAAFGWTAWRFLGLLEWKAKTDKRLTDHQRRVASLEMDLRAVKERTENRS